MRTAVARTVAVVLSIGCGSSSSPIPPLGSLPVYSVDLTTPSPSVQVDETIRLRAVPRDSLGRALDSVVVWTAENLSPATGIILIKQDGSATGNAPGPVKVTAVSGRRSASLSVTVTNIPVDSVGISPGGFNGPVGASTSFAVSLYSAPPRRAITTLRRQYAWTVSDRSVVSLDTTSAFPLGQASPSRPVAFIIARGKATITVTVEGRSVSFTMSGS